MKISNVFLVALLGLVGCGGSSKTQDKIDSANADYRRLQLIDVELRSLGVNLGEPTRADRVVETMDVRTLERTRALLSEFLNRGANVVTVTQRKDVSVVNGAMGNVEFALRQAGRLKIKVLEVIDARAGFVCTSASPTIARQAAKHFVGGLRTEVTSEVDWDRVEVERLDEGCGLFRVTFRSVTRRGHRLDVVIDRNAVLQDRSDRGFNRR